MLLSPARARAAALGSGLLAAFSSVVCLAWPVVWVSLIPLFLAIRGKRAKQGLGLGCWLGLGVALPSLYWMVEGVARFTGSGNPGYGLLAYAGSSALLMLFFSGLVAALALAGRLRSPRWLRALSMAAVWTLWETTLSALLAGMPWFSFHVGSGLLKNLYAIQPAAIGGIALLSLVPVLVNYLAADFIAREKWKALLIPGGIAGAFLGLGLLMLAVWKVRRPASSPVRVAILSENVPPDQKWDQQNGPRLVASLLGLAREASALHPDIALWSESIVPWTYRPDDDFVLALLEATQGSGATHILGINTEYEATTAYNSAYAILPSGRVAGHYDKRVLLSFLEAPVAGWVMPFVSTNGFTVAPGAGGKPLPTPHGRAGILICNEAAVPAAATDMAAGGAEFFLNLSNDGWFSRTYLADLHFYSARLRAVEVRKDVVVNSNTGFSGLIAASGEVVLARRSEEPYVEMVRLFPNQRITLLTRCPGITESLCVLLLLLAAGREWRCALKRKITGLDRRTRKTNMSRHLMSGYLRALIPYTLCMKRLLLIATLALNCSGAFAFSNLGSYRWRNDDGDETTATWKPPENVPIVFGSTVQTLRLRLELYDGPNDGIPGASRGLFYLTPANQAIQVTDNTSNAFYYVSSTQVANGTPTTNQLTANPVAEAFPFIPGEIISTLSAGNVILATSQQTELEHVIRPGTGLAANTVYRFRQSNPISNAAFATLTTATALPVWLVSFTATLEQGRVVLRWETGAEERNERFEVMKSEDGINWRCIATRQGAGNATGARRYDAQDSEPNGVAFYRLDQYDIDGAMMSSSVQMVQSKTRLPEVTAYPKPMTGTQLSLHVPIAAEADVAAVMSDMTGAVVYRTTIHTEPGRLDYTLILPRQPAPGLYRLRLEAQGLSRTIPITVK